MNIIEIIARELDLREKSVESAVNLMDEGCTIPFISRYRKEVTGNLTDVELRKIEERLAYLRKLDERINTVLKSIEDQGKLTDELKEQILNVKTLSELEDLYRPYKPKKRTRAIIAKEKGLEPLANFILSHDHSMSLEEKAKEFINEEKKVKNVEEAIQGAKDIIAEIISDEPKFRTYIKKKITKEGKITSKEIKKDEKDTYAQYADYAELISKIPPHRILALNRGENEKCLRIALDFDVEDIKAYIGKRYIKHDEYDAIFYEVIDDSCKRLIFPSVENEVRNDLFAFAEDKSIIVFKKNLEALLMYPPLKGKVILGFDPGFRTGCKYALVDEFGRMKMVGQVFITAASGEKVKMGVYEIAKILANNKVDYIALGNGTASRESEEVLRKMLQEKGFNTKLFIVNESGASVYSASKVGEQEFPNLPVEKRSAISLARRLQDPLSELVKIDPKSIGVGQYQHDMDQSKLEGSLNGVVEDCVNTVGVDVNNASVSLLKYISGINKSIAENTVKYIEENGPFRNREQLKKVPKMGAKAFEQCAGFLRVTGGNEPLDSTSIHPESYDFARQIIKKCNINILKDSSDIKENKLSLFNKEEFIKETKIGRETLNDLIAEIIKPGRDVRDALEIVELNNETKSIEDLKVGQILTGTVRNIMDFGCFVDINVHQDGLVHISEISNKFIKHPSDVLTVNDIVKVKVISVDVAKKRIGLSIKQAN